ncbi:MAG: glutamyl-tRNA reductase, partial [Bacilli bacterium]
MHILVLGLNYKTAPVEIREQFAFQPDELEEAMMELRQMKSILECVIIGTCNRTEIYAVVDQLHTGEHFIKSFLEKRFGIMRAQFGEHIYIHQNDHAVEHLFKVACGLDSLVLGETQILGQVRDAFMLAQQSKTSGSLFNACFKQAITIGKRAHSETAIGENAVSISYAAIELAKKIFGTLKDKSVLIVGAGKMSELTAKHLHANGVKEVTVINRTFTRAEELATKFQGKALDFSHLTTAMERADILISSTGARGYVVTPETVRNALNNRRHKPLFMIDIAVPRDIDPVINQLDNIYLYDIDDLEDVVQANLAEREKEAEKLHVLINEGVIQFKHWLNTLGVVPIITALRDKALTIQEETMRSIENKLPDLTERELTILRKHTKTIVNQLLRDQI